MPGSMNGRPGFYAYTGHAELGAERLGSEGKFIWWDLKTRAGAIKRARRVIRAPYMLYRFTNFYDNETFELVHTE